MVRVDADAHVIESQQTWDFLEPGEEKYRPSSASDEHGNKYWVIERQLHSRDAGNQELALGIRNLEDVDGRLRAMDEFGHDVQVLYPTLFLQGQPTEDPRGQVALSRAYNRWLAEAYKASDGRLRWAILPPILDMEAALEELEFGRDNGAAAVFMRGLEGRYLIDDPYLEPLLSKAHELDLTIGIHAGNGSNDMKRLLFPRDLFFFGITPILACFNRLMTSGLPERFPGLRFGFLEAGSEWVPYLLREVSRRASTIGIAGEFNSTETLLEDKNVWVACRSDDDVAHVVRQADPGRFVIGTDFGHEDPAAELEALDNLANAEGLSSRVVEQITGENAAKLYGLDG